MRWTIAASASFIFHPPATGWPRASDSRIHVVAVAAARAALLDSAAQSAAGLGRQILEGQAVYGSLEADMQFGSFALNQATSFTPQKGSCWREGFRLDRDPL